MSDVNPSLAPGAVTSRLHISEPDTGRLPRFEFARIARIRFIGTTGAVAMAAGALGAGALPVIQNPALGERGIGIWLRVQHASMTIAMIGMVVVVLCWLLLAPYTLGSDLRGRHRPRLDRVLLDRVIAAWALPLALAPPMFSKDVYSYLAQGAIASELDDPYALGPVSALGANHPLTINVPDMWRDTPNQYGPVFLGIQQVIYEITGENVPAGLLLHRIVAIAGIILLGWAVPRLAVRCRVSDVAALWLAVANPLVLFHLVSGIHSEALMMGLLAAGLELCLRALEGGRRGSTRRRRAVFVLGVVMVTASALVKLPAIVALGFVGMALARHRGGNAWDVVRAALTMILLAGLTIAVFMLLTGSGFGWVTKLGAATELRSWLSPPTAFGVVTAGIGELLGLGDHSEQMLAIVQTAALIAAAVWTVRMLFAVRAGRIHPVGGFGLSMGAIVLCFPVVHPWYLMWALVPLAVWATRRAFRYPVIVMSVILSCFTLPPGTGLTPWVTVQSWVVTLIALVLVLLALFRFPGLLRFRTR